MQKYKTMTDFGGTGFIPIASSLVTAIPQFFSILIFFLVWIGGTLGTYFAVSKLYGRKRFFHSWTAWSLVSFFVSLGIAGMNNYGGNGITYISGYWIAFYILMTGVAYFLLDKYK